MSISGKPRVSAQVVALTLIAGAAAAQNLDGRDSAGVRIVQLRLPEASMPPRWRLDSSASIVVGKGEDRDHELNAIKGGAILSDGSIVVVNGRPIELRQFGSDGELRQRFGRQGAGPGEFRMIASYQHLAADTVVIFDRSLRRVSLIAWGGTLPSSQSISFAPLASPGYPMGLHTVVGRMANGTYVVMGPARGPAAGKGLATPRFRLVVMRPMLDVGQPVGEFDGDDLYFAPARGGQMFGAPPFGRVSRVLVAAHGFYVARSDQIRILQYDTGGQLRAIYRSTRAPARLRPADIRRAVDSAVLASGAPRDEEFAKASQYKTAPAFGDVAIDRAGTLWLKEFELDSRPMARWNVVDGSGVLVGSIDLPSAARIMDVAGDTLLLLTRDADGVERIELWRIHKNR